LSGNRALVFIGFMGAGKTTVGRMLAARLGWDFLDLDACIETRTGLTVPSIFAAHGEEHFRKLESQALAAATSQTFAQVAEVLQADYVQAGTYLGAQLPVGSGVTLVQATATTYCLETNVSGTLVHEHGPGGTPGAGAC